MSLLKRHLRVNTCKECTNRCVNQKACDEAKKPVRNYDGIRFTSDGFDCALPISIDSHTVCSYGCLYCFSDNLVQHREGARRAIGQMSLAKLEAIFAGGGGKRAARIRKALKYDRKKNGYPCAVQLGAICDPADNIERQQGWLLEFLKISQKYGQPVRASVKGDAFLHKDYTDIVARRPDLLWVAFSIITCDDELLERIDRRAPNATQRLKVMKHLSDLGVKTSLRFRPILPCISDSTKKYPQAYKTLIHKAAEAGCKAISYEVGFVPSAVPKDIKARWQAIADITGVPFFDLYRSFGKSMACMRPPFSWTENIMHAIKEEAVKCGLTVGVSDPVWKQLTDSGCCCGILPDDPVFGNWERENATNALFEAKKTGKEITLKDIVPPWASEQLLCEMVNMGVGPKIVYKRKHLTWADKLKDVWNGLETQRGPLNYFQGALMPVRRDEEGNMVYEYKGLERQNRKVKYWKT